MMFVLAHNHQIHFNTSNFSSCHHCKLTKSHKLPFFHPKSTTSHPLQHIHSDVWGPSVLGFIFYVVFIDDFTKYTWLYHMKTKSEVFSKFIQFKITVENEFDFKIKVFNLIMAPNL